MTKEQTRFRVDCRDVLDVNGKTRRPFSGRIRGQFRRTGPNSWDDYEYVPQYEVTIEVLPGLRIYLEPKGAEFRMRRQGKVIRVEWLPTDSDRQKMDGAEPSHLRQYFISDYVESFDDAPGIGVAAWIAGKLQ